MEKLAALEVKLGEPLGAITFAASTVFAVATDGALERLVEVLDVQPAMSVAQNTMDGNGRDR